MSTIDQNIIEKLQKILAKADLSRGSTEAEVQTAMKLAQKIALEHNIDLATVSATGDVTVGPIETDASVVHTDTKYESPHHDPIRTVLRVCFEVSSIATVHWTHSANQVISKVTLVGEKTDLAIATYCWAYLLELFPKCWNEAKKIHGFRESMPARRSFFKGLAAGICDTNRRQREDLSKGDADKFGLVLVKKEEAVLAKKHELFPHLKPSRQTNQAFNHDAASAGRERGRSIRLNAGLEGTSRSALK